MVKHNCMQHWTSETRGVSHVHFKLFLTKKPLERCPRLLWVRPRVFLGPLWSSPLCWAMLLPHVSPYWDVSVLCMWLYLLFSEKVRSCTILPTLPNMYFKYQISTNREVLAADSPACLPSLACLLQSWPIRGLHGLRPVREGQCHCCFMKSNFRIELDLIRLFEFPPECSNPTRFPLNLLPLTILPTQGPQPQRPPAASLSRDTHPLFR